MPSLKPSRTAANAASISTNKTRSVAPVAAKERTASVAKPQVKPESVARATAKNATAQAARSAATKPRVAATSAGTNARTGVKPKQSKPAQVKPVQVKPDSNRKKSGAHTAAKAQKPPAANSHAAKASSAPQTSHAARASSQQGVLQGAFEMGMQNGATKNGATKTRRARVPADLAAQYGEKVRDTAKRQAAQQMTPAATRRARRDAQAREQLRRVMTPDDDLLRRLARAGAIAALPAPANGEDDFSRRARAATTRRPRRWESRCGKCGTGAVFTAAAGLCARCGAIAVRE